jgi:alanine dehydrogenase
VARILVLSRDDVARSVSFPDAIAAAGEALAAYSLGRARAPTRTVLPVPEHGGTALFMPGFVPEPAALGAKIVSVYPGNAASGLPTICAMVALVNPATGEPLAVMEGSYLTALRTAAASAVATRHLARRDATTVAVIGCGVQAATQLEGICNVRKVRTARVFDLDRVRAAAFATRMGPIVAPLGTRVEAVAGGAEDAVRGADIVVTATTARAPVFDAAAVAPGAHINAIGAFTPEMREIPAATLLRAGKVYVDGVEAAWVEAGDLIIPLREGLIGRDRVDGEIGEVVAGRKPGRENDTEVTVFKSVGLSVLDMAVGALAYRRAVARGAGTWVDLG